MELTGNSTNSFQGIAVSPGIAFGRVMKMAGPGDTAPEKLTICEEALEAEIERLHAAIEATGVQLASLQKELRLKLNNLDADIFEANIEEIRGNWARALELHRAGAKRWHDDMDFVSGARRMIRKGF